MKQVLSILSLATVLFAMSLMAADKVVVIPMGSSAKGTGGQVQYNDDGKTAGAEVYYDKATGKLEVPGEVRTVDGAGDTRLWGKGRPGTTLLEHTDPNGYCTTVDGINYALSKVFASWYTASEVCPTGTWVCSFSELPTSGSCDIQEFSGFRYFNCDGSPGSYVLLTYLNGWLSDTSPFNHFGRVQISSFFNIGNYDTACLYIPVWCCWE